MKNCTICLDEKKISEFVSYDCKCKEITCCAACILTHTMEQSKKDHILNTVRCPCCNHTSFKISGNVLLEARAKEGLPEIYLSDESSIIHPNYFSIFMVIILVGIVALNVLAIVNLTFLKAFALDFFSIIEKLIDL